MITKLYYLFLCVDFKLKKSHFAYKIIQKMLEDEPKKRINLREIIPSLFSLNKLVSQKYIHESGRIQQTSQEVSLHS